MCEAGKHGTETLLLRSRNQESEGEGRQEGRDDEAHSPEVKLAQLLARK